MKILLDAHAAIQKKTGIGRYSDNLTRELLKQKNISVSLYTHSPLPKKYLKHNRYHALLKNGFYRVLWGLNSAIRKLKPDILHINNFAPIFKTRPIVMTVHDLCLRTHPDKYSFKNRLSFKLFFGISLKKADAIICVSESVKKELLRLYDVDSDKVRVIHEGKDPSIKHIASRKHLDSLLDRKFGIQRSYFLVVGNIEARKNPFLIIDAFSKSKNKNLSLVFTGPNPLKKELEKKYIKLIDKGRLIFTEYVSDADLNALYNSALSVVYYSTCEGFGLPLVESMSTKTPVIASDIKVFREVGRDAPLFVKNKKELTKAMEKLAKNKSLRTKMAARGYKISKRYSWSKAVKQTLAVYKKVALTQR